MFHIDPQRGYLLSTRAILLGVGAFLFLFAAQASVRFYFNLPALQVLIDQSDSKDRQRIDNALQQRVASYHSRVLDNALWNDAYEFVQRPTDTFIRTNFDRRTLEDNELDGVIFLDVVGKVVWQYSLAQAQNGGKPARLGGAPITDSALLRAFHIPSHIPVAGKFQTKSGYIQTAEAPLVFAASPIFPTDLGSGKLSSQGTLIMWSWLDADYVASIAEQTKLNFHAQFLKDGAQSLAPAWTFLANGDMHSRDKNNRISWLLDDVNGRPLMRLWIDLEPSTFEANLFSGAMLVGIVAALILLLVLAYAVRKWLVDPLMLLGMQMSAITSTGNYQNRLTVKSYRELDRLAEQFNLLLDEVCKQQLLAQRRHAEMHLVSISDGLTGLANRRYLDQYMDESWSLALAASSTFGLMLIDIDYFKAYNDRYGHAAGDQILRQVAHKLRSFQPDSHALTARYGGEEFCIVITGWDAVALELLCQQICDGVREEQIEHLGSALALNAITVSIGATLFDTRQISDRQLTDKQVLRDIFKAADQALYQAKNAGRNRVCMAVSGEL